MLQLPLTRNGNQYVVCFVDYLTKWVEAFAMPDQQAETLARLFVDNVECIGMVFWRNFCLTEVRTFYRPWCKVCVRC